MPTIDSTAEVSRKWRKQSRRVCRVHNGRLVHRLWLQCGVGASHLCVFSALRHGSDAQAQVRGYQTGHQQDAEKDDQRGGESDRSHADHWRTRFDGSDREHHGIGGRAVCGVVQGERQVTRGYYFDDAVDAHGFLFGGGGGAGAGGGAGGGWPTVKSRSDASFVSGMGRTNAGVYV